MKFFILLFTSLNLLILPTLAEGGTALAEGNKEHEESPVEQEEKEEKEDKEKKTVGSEQNESESTDQDDEEEDREESEEAEEKAKEPTPEEIARLEKLILADRLYKKGDKAAAIALYREAKQPWEIETAASDPAIAFSDPKQLSPAGQVFWRNYQEGKAKKLETRILSPLKLLTAREPEFIPGHLAYASELKGFEREAESQKVLELAIRRHSNEPQILRAKMNADVAAEKWLDASIIARQYALFNPESKDAEEFQQLAEEYLAQYQSDLRSSITWNAIGNAIAGTVGFALTGNLFGPLSALETSSLLLKGESAVGESAVGQIQKQVPLLQDEEVNAYVDRIGQKIASASGREEFDYEFHVVMDDALNAFALPGGKIFVNAGAIMETDSEAELAGLLAHEVSHSALSHGFQLATKGNLTANIVSYIPYVGNTASSLIVLNYSREMEKQADVFGTRILVNSGYAADGVRNLMAQLHEHHQDKDNSEPPAWLSSHPNTTQRINYMEQLIVDNNLDRYAYEGVEEHQRIAKLVQEKWEKYDKCVKDVDSIAEAKVCAGEEKLEEELEESKEERQEPESAESKAENEETSTDSESVSESKSEELEKSE